MRASKRAARIPGRVAPSAVMGVASAAAHLSWFRWLRIVSATLCLSLVLLLLLVTGASASANRRLLLTVRPIMEITERIAGSGEAVAVLRQSVEAQSDVETGICGERAGEALGVTAAHRSPSARLL